jgi:hypothetical protein
VTRLAMHTIQRKPDYILVTLSGDARIAEVLAANRDLMARDDYATSQVLYLLNDCNLQLSQGDFARVAQTILLRYPANATRTKTALVTGSAFVRVMTTFWSEAAKILPFQTRAFATVDLAEKWLAE